MPRGDEANQQDFLGEGTAAPAQAPAQTPEEIELARKRKAIWLAGQGLDENGNPLPAYGTPQSQGGTATQYQTTVSRNNDLFPGTNTTIRRMNPDGSPSTVVGGWTDTDPGTAIRDPRGNPTGAVVPEEGLRSGDGTLRDMGGFYRPPENLFSAGAIGAYPGGAGGTGGGAGGVTGQTKSGTAALQEDITRRQTGAIDELRSTTASMPGSPLANPNATQQAGNQARGALGSAPQIDMGLADRQSGGVQQALDQSGKVVDAALAPIDQTALERATADARSVLDRLLTGPNTAKRLGSQTLRSQLALAKSAAGGPGAVQEALRQQQFAAPELEAQAAEQATQETIAREQAAGQVAGQLQNTALGAQQNETARIGAGAQAASGQVAGQLGARGQDIEIAKNNQNAANALLQNVAQLTGQQLELDQRSQELMGQMARDLAAQNFNWAQLSTQQQDAEFDRWIKAYGIDVAAAAQIKAAAEQSNKGVMDYLIPIIGSLATVAAVAA